MPPAWPNMKYSILSNAQVKLVYKVTISELWFIFLLRLEQKSSDGETKTAQKFITKGYLILNACTETFLVFKVCLLLLKYETFIQCGKDQSCLTEAMFQPDLTYAQQLLSRCWDIDADEDVCSSARAYVRVIEANEVGKLLKNKSYPKGILQWKCYRCTSFTIWPWNLARNSCLKSHGTL